VAVTRPREVVAVTKQGTAQDGRVDIADVAVSATAPVAPERIYAVLADLPTHTTWAGTMHGKKNYGLRSLDAPEGPAGVGTEFRSTGIDPMGSFSDRSVVTEATSPSVFEFVTEGHLTPKKRGKPASDTRITYRFEMDPAGESTSVRYRAHISRWTEAPALLRSKALQPLARIAMKSYARRMLRNLIAYTGER
jgi:hypothetical protein